MIEYYKKFSQQTTDTRKARKEVEERYELLKKDTIRQIESYKKFRVNDDKSSWAEIPKSKDAYDTICLCMLISYIEETYKDVSIYFDKWEGNRSVIILVIGNADTN